MYALEGWGLEWMMSLKEVCLKSQGRELGLWWKLKIGQPWKRKGCRDEIEFIQSVRCNPIQSLPNNSYVEPMRVEWLQPTPPAYHHSPSPLSLLSPPPSVSVCLPECLAPYTCRMSFYHPQSRLWYSLWADEVQIVWRVDHEKIKKSWLKVAVDLTKREGRMLFPSFSWDLF